MHIASSTLRLTSTSLPPPAEAMIQFALIVVGVAAAYASSSSSPSSSPATPSAAGREIAAYLEQTMNTSASACADFYAYACGRYAHAHAADERPTISGRISDENSDALAEALLLAAAAAQRPKVCLFEYGLLTPREIKGAVPYIFRLGKRPPSLEDKCFC